MATLTPNLKLIPSLATAVEKDSQSLGLSVTALVAVLVRNDSISPAELAQIPPEKFSRVVVQCSLRTEIRRMAQRGAARAQLPTINAYLESLLSARVKRGGPLLVLQSKIGAKL